MLSSLGLDNARISVEILEIFHRQTLFLIESGLEIGL